MKKLLLITLMFSMSNVFAYSKNLQWTHEDERMEKTYEAWKFRKEHPHHLNPPAYPYPHRGHR